MRYEEAVSACPAYLHFDIAVIQSNMAACHLKDSAWKDAVSASTASLDRLAKLGGKPGEPEREGRTEDKGKDGADTGKRVVDAPAPLHEASEIASAPPSSRPPPAPADISRIRAKALMRRARARTELGGWSNLAGAEEDYTALAAMDPGVLGTADRKTVTAQLRRLPPLVAAAKEKEVSEMWGKLKGLGDGLLKPFGMSTDNFKMVKDEKTGGYSMSFTNGKAE